MIAIETGLYIIVCSLFPLLITPNEVRGVRRLYRFKGSHINKTSYRMATGFILVGISMIIAGVIDVVF